MGAAVEQHTFGLSGLDLKGGAHSLKHLGRSLLVYI